MAGGSELGSAHVSIFPQMKGFRQNVAKETGKAVSDLKNAFSKGFNGAQQGKQVGNAFKNGFNSGAAELNSDALKSFKKDVAQASQKNIELDDKVKAFEIGANDYLTKPFYMEELVARVYAILRTTGKLKNKNVLQFKDLHVDINEKRVFINDCEIELQNKQFNLLEYFLLNKGCILLKEQIYDRIWGLDSDSTIEIVEVYVSNLRKKLSKFGYDKYIKTKRKVGYIFDDK